FWTGTDLGADGKSRVMFVWEPLPAAANARASETPARVMLTAMASDGRPVFRGPVGAATPEAATGTSPTSGSAAPSAAAAPPAAGASVTFSADPGPIEMRMVVENARGQIIDSTTQTVTVPDYAKTTVSFGTPRVFRARTAREMLLARNNPDAAPT